MSLLSIGTNALNANQQAINTVGRNIANVNSDGYTRNVTRMGEQGVPMTGVTVDVQRITDTFMTTQVWKDNYTLASDEAMSSKLSFLDSIVGSTSNNISTRLDEYFAAMQTVADEPTLISARQLFLSEADSLAKTFNTIDAKMQDQNDLILQEMKAAVAGVNELAQSIADFNGQIQAQEGMGKNVSELLDERDRLVKELSSLVGTNVVVDSNNRFNIFLGQGQPLVVANNANTLSLMPGANDPNEPQIFLKSEKGVETDITSQIYGGEISGLMEYRDEVLAPARSELGRLAIVFANTMNEQNRKGIDINGAKGSNIFNPMNTGSVLVNTNNNATSSSGSMSFYDVTELTTSDYSVRIGKPDMSGNPTFEITRESDGKVFKSTQMTEVSTLPATNTLGMGQAGVYQTSGTNVKFSIDGFTVSINASSIVEGDEFTLQPTKNGAGQIKSTLKNPSLVAAASPVRTYEGTSNTGTGTISDINVLNTMDSSPLRMGGATLPLRIEFNPLNALGEENFTVYDSSVSPEVAIASLTGVVYAEDMTVEIDGYEFSIGGSPNVGDEFILEKNKNGASDNTNFLQMVDLQSADTLDGNNYQDAYGQMLAWVGIKAQNANLSYTASSSALETSESALESVRGVNLDEEAANLVKFQQAYAAAAQIITAQQTIFTSLLNAVRG